MPLKHQKTLFVILTNCVVICEFHTLMVVGCILMRMCHQLQLLAGDGAEPASQMLPDPGSTSWGYRGSQYTPPNSSINNVAHIVQKVGHTAQENQIHFGA